MPREDDVRRIVSGGRARGLSDDQIRALVARYDQRQASTPPPSGATAGMTDQSTVQGDPAGPRTWGDTVRDVAGGVRSSVARTVYGGGDLIRRATGMERIYDRPDVQAAMRAPDSTAGAVGSFAGEAAQFAVPLARVTRVMRGAPLLARAGADAVASAGVAGVQSAGDPNDMIMAGAAGGVLPFAGAAARATGRTVQRAAAGAKEGGLGGAVASAVRTVAPGEPRTLLIQALKPRSVKANFPLSLDRALPELKAAEQALGKPIADIDTLIDATTVAKWNIQGQLNQVRGTAQSLEIDGSSVADAMVRSIPKKLALENPEAAKRLIDAANVYRQRFSLDDFETLLRETNAELEGFYAKHLPSQRKALLSDPIAATLDAQGKAMRTALDAGLDRMAEGGGAAAKELRRRYGALLDIEGEAWRRANVAKRQQPESLSEQIGAVRAAADMARGAWRLAHLDWTGAADVAAANAGRSTAKFLKEQQTTDALIRRAFEGFKGRPSPVTLPTRRPVRGYLPAAARQMPSSAESGRYRVDVDSRGRARQTFY